mgnify:CR=1 FL=1
MNYTKEMCVFLLSNPQLIEEDSLTEHVEATVFKAINTAISKRLGERSPWRTRFGLVVEDDDGNDDGSFDLYGDDDHIDTFDTLQEAIDCANDNLSDYREFEIRDEDGDVVETITGEKAGYTVYADGDEIDSFDSLDAARDKAIRLFSSGDYSDVRVENEDGDDVVNMTM